MIAVTMFLAFIGVLLHYAFGKTVLKIYACICILGVIAFVVIMAIGAGVMYCEVFPEDC